MTTQNKKVHRQYLRITSIPKELTQTRSRPRGLKLFGESIMVYKDSARDQIINKLKSFGIESEPINYTETKQYCPCGHRIRKLHGDNVIAIRANSEDELIDEIRRVKKDLDANKIKYDDMCRWLCVS